LTGYQLLDFGGGRKLESLNGYVVVRPSPAADHASPRSPKEAWDAASAAYSAEERRWTFRDPWPETIALKASGFYLRFRATPFGHIGCFPEQMPNWAWLAGKVSASSAEGSPSRCLNLFAHTGGSTLAMAAAGGNVAHVDAAKPSVAAARQAAQENSLGDAPIRYLVEDAAKYVAREVRRGQTYDLIVLDPPGYGHGPGGKTWRIQRDLWPLIDDCLRLLGAHRSAMLVTGHSETPDQHAIAEYLRDKLTGNRPGESGQTGRDKRLRIDSGRSELTDSAGRRLDAGYYVRAAW
jgi:23S rRNA (cytosine1962-C5)-methyltransferase